LSAIKTARSQWVVSSYGWSHHLGSAHFYFKTIYKHHSAEDETPLCRGDHHLDCDEERVNLREIDVASSTRKHPQLQQGRDTIRQIIATKSIYSQNQTKKNPQKHT